MKKDIMQTFFGNETVSMLDNNICPVCCKPVNQAELKDEISRQEFKLSGMCQECQDKIFQ